MSHEEGRDLTHKGEDLHTQGGRFQASQDRKGHDQKSYRIALKSEKSSAWKEDSGTHKKEGDQNSTRRHYQSHLEGGLSA